MINLKTLETLPVEDVTISILSSFAIIDAFEDFVPVCA